MSVRVRKVLKEQRRVASAKAKETIIGMSDEDLRNLACEIGREMNQQSAVVNQLRIRLEAIRSEVERRRTITAEGIHVSDHAVLRYLERYKGLDTREIRNEIADFARRSGKIDSGEQYARPKDEKTGVIFGFNGISNVVTTVLSSDHSSILDIPRAAPSNPA